METNHSILCIVEGEKTELKILERLDTEFIKKNISFISIGTNIYHLYHSYLQEINEVGDELNIFIFLKRFDKKKILEGKQRRNFRAIYLFLDLDRHEPLADRYLECLPEMLDVFNNETENGKLYISYPMVEAFKHPIYKTELFNIAQGKAYKEYVANICENEINHFTHQPLNREQWSKFLVQHIKTTHYLLNANFGFPLMYQEARKLFNQANIYQNQLENFITPNNQVLILSPFALFLLEYLGEPLFEEWQKIAK